MSPNRGNAQGIMAITPIAFHGHSAEQAATSPRYGRVPLWRQGHGPREGLRHERCPCSAEGERETYLAVAPIGRPSMATKAEDFNEWYNEVVDRAGLRDKRYPVKGMDVWTPYGWAAMTRIDNRMRAEMERTGHGEVNFPLHLRA